MNAQKELKAHSAHMKVEKDQQGVLKLIMKGRLDADSIGSLWRKAEQILQQSKPKSLIIDAVFPEKIFQRCKIQV